MPTPIRLKRSAVSGKKPTSLQKGELALNFYDAHLFAERDTGGVGIGTTITNLTPWIENYGGGSIYYPNSIGIGSVIPNARVAVNPLTGFSTSGDIGGISVRNYENKTYPSSFTRATLGLYQENEVGGITSYSSGSGFIYGTQSILIKENNNTQDIFGLRFTASDNRIVWNDQNTAHQLIASNNAIEYSGADANGRTSNVFSADSVTLSPADGATQTINRITSANSTLINPLAGINTVNITTINGIRPNLPYIFNITSGTHNVSITDAAIYDTSSDWGVLSLPIGGTLNATLGNYYGLRLKQPSDTTGLTIANKYGVYSAWSEAINYFSGTVGIGTTTPRVNLDIVGTVRADTYDNFKLSDLPNDVTEIESYGRNRVLKVTDDATSYELVDPHELEAYKLSSYGVSNDPTVYSGIGSNVGGKLQISGISTSKFDLDQELKIFGVTKTSDSATFPTIPSGSVSKVGTAATASLYRYWIAQYNYRNGKVGISTQINEGIGHLANADFNDQEHISLTINRDSVNNGILVYRQISGTGVSTNINDAKLIAVLGPKELGSSSSGIIWQDYGVYEQTEWSGKDNKNQFTDDGQIHFPNIATTGQRRGWEMDKIVSIGMSNITVSGVYNYNDSVGFGTTSIVKVTHDNTAGLSTAISDTIASGGNYLDLPSGTFITSKLVLPTGFTLRGNGKNTIIKQQYYANDSTDAQGNALSFNGRLVSAASTNFTDVTISEITIDGNNLNNINYETDEDNYLVYLKGIRSSLIKDIEIRNTPAHGIYIHDSRRVSVENCVFVDGSLTDRFPFQPFSAQDSQTLRINDSLFENFPGPVDISVTTITSTGGNIIRNCGTGLRTYASGKITTTNNIILGPADEYIPSPDIYDSDFNSINITVDRSANFNSPFYLYLENGEPKDISDTAIDTLTAGIGTIVGQGTTNETLGDKFMFMNIINPNTETINNKFTRDLGYLQVGLTTSQTSTLGLTSALGYEILATEFITPVGYTTIGIQTGSWNTIGSGATNYTVTLSDSNQFAGVSVGDIVKLVDHSTSPDISVYELTVETKITSDTKLRLTGFGVTSIQNGTNSGYIVVKNNFVIAKGRVGVI